MKLERRVAELTAELEAVERPAQAERAEVQCAFRRPDGLVLGACRRPDGLVGLGSRHQRMAMGRGPVSHLRRRPAKFEVTAENIRSLVHPDDWKALQQRVKRMSRARARSRPSFACSAPMARRAGAPEPHPPASMQPAGSCASAASPSTSPIARRPKSARPCWRARSITGPVTRLRSSNRSSGSPGRRASTITWRQSRAASRRWRAPIRCSPIRAGTAPISPASSPRNWRPIGPATRSPSAAPIFRCSLRRLRGLRWRCTSLPPTRPSMERWRR